MPSSLATLGWSRAEVAEAVGVSQDTLDNWVKRNLLRPSIGPLPEPGAPRRWDHVDVAAARLVAHGRRFGLGSEVLASITPALRAHNPNPDTRLLVVISRPVNGGDHIVLVQVGPRATVTAAGVDDMTEGVKVVMATRTPRLNEPLSVT